MPVAGYATLSRTVAELVTDTERHLGKNRYQMNKLNDASGMTASLADVSLICEFEMGGIRNGAYVEVDDEVMYVWSVSGQTATVERAMLGSTLATHADDSIVRVNPRFFRVDILKALREEINSWPRSIYAVLKGEFNAAIDVTSLDLAGIPSGGQALRLLKVYREQANTTETPDRWSEVTGVRLEAAANTDAFPTGWRLVWPRHYSASAYQVVIGGPFVTTTFTSATDLGTIGLTASMIDIPSLGAAGRLLLPKEVDRTQVAAIGRSRLADEVPPGHTSRTAQELLAFRDARIADEAKRLLNDYGWTE